MPKSVKQLTYTADQQIRTNAGRVAKIEYEPPTGRARVTFVIGEYVGGEFIVRKRLSRTWKWEDLSAAIQGDFSGLEDKALAWAVNRGIFEAGVIETDPS